MTYLDFDEQDEQAEANARIRDLRERRDYWMTRLSEGRNTEILNERVMFYVGYLDDLEQIPFVNVWLPKQAQVIAKLLRVQNVSTSKTDSEAA